jgi:3-dehydroquinate dehydratase-1
MPHAQITLLPGHPWVVGSIGSAEFLRQTNRPGVLEHCDIVEIRLDVLRAAGVAVRQECWQHLTGVPMLFTARCKDEGGALDLTAAQRSELLLSALDTAACIDVELASLDSMPEILTEATRRSIPWIASLHDFNKLPTTQALTHAAQRALAAGAAAFKVAAMLHTPADLLRLAEFQLAAHGLPLATMGMGSLAPVSRLLCAQLGSVLNYGYLGDSPTAPGQWDCGLLRQAIRRLTPI